jgi:Yip1 domain
VDVNKIIARAKAILVTPKTEWPVIAGEPSTVGDLFKGYIFVLAAIPAVFAFLQMSVVGTNMWFAGRMRFGVGTGLSMMVVQYVLALAGVYVMGLIIDALAPTFGGQKDRVQAVKTIGYASTAYWIASIASILPGLGWLIGIIGGIYSIYLLYLGLPHTMKAPQDRAAGYTAVAIVVAIIVNIVIGAVVGSVVGLGAGSFMNAAITHGSSPASDDVQFDEDSTLGKLEKWSKDVEKAGKEFEAAQKSGDQDAQSDAMKAMMGAALGSGGEVESLAPDRLKPFLPESLAGMTRSNYSAQRNNAMGLQISEARATYSNEAGRSVNLEITDTGNAKGMLALAGWAGLEGEQESDQGYEKTYRLDGRLVHESWDKSSSSGEYVIVLGDRFTVKVDGQADSVDELKAALGEIDLRALEALKDEGAKAN